MMSTYHGGREGGPETLATSNEGRHSHIDLSLPTTWGLVASKRSLVPPILEIRRKEGLSPMINRFPKA